MLNQQERGQLVDFICRSFADICKEPAGELHFPYVIPGGPYATDLWDWDSYWTLFAALKIAELRRDAAFLEKIRPYACGTFFNFLDHQGPDGALPICLQPKHEDIFDSLSDPTHNMAKPFIGQTGKLLLEHHLIAKEEIARWIDRLHAFHQCYWTRYGEERTGLVVWGKDWGIGVDDDPTAWGRPDRSCASVFLNSFLYRELEAGAELADYCGRADLAAAYRDRQEALGKAIRRYCYDVREKAFFSVDVQCRQQLAQLPLGTINVNLQPFWNVLQLKVLLWSAILPFWNGLGSAAEFDAFCSENLTQERLRSPYGIRSLSADEPMYRPEEKRGNPSNWLGPLWIVANYVVWDTLHRRGHAAEAERLSDDVLAMLWRDLQSNGKLHEYYSPESGLGLTNPGFISWNALAAVMALSK